MKNSKYFPFERNKYFYGKLLSVDDFDLEQRYENNKRRMVNRFLHGAGVVAGLNVVRIDERTISLESGFALDSLGREIVVDMPMIQKLSLLEGYDACVESSDKEYVYLCLDYDEEETGLVHNVAGNTIMASESSTFNRIKETYRLYLTETEPEQEELGKCALYEQEHILYAQNGMKIKLTVPRYAVTGGEGEIRVEIENITKKYLAFSCELQLDCLNYEGQSLLKINFNEVQYEKTGKYEFTYKVEAAELTEATAAVRINPKEVRLFLNKEPLEFYGKPCNLSIVISREDVRTQIIKNYYRTAMDNIVKVNHQEHLYLAKIYLLRTADGCTIDHVVTFPFNQFLLNQNLSFALHQLTIDGIGARGDSVPASRSQSVEGMTEKKNDNGVRFAQGSTWLDLDGGGQRGDRFFSEEIPHGLGIGPVCVQVGLEDSRGGTTYGSSEIFDDMEVMIELAVRVFPERGTFQIGGRLREQVIKSGVSVHWTAIMNQEKKVTEKLSRKIFIKPSVLELGARESHYLEAVCTNMDDKNIEWKVQKHGGTITENGMYTAPNMPGVYEVVAQSTAYPDVKASIFVVVREI